MAMAMINRWQPSDCRKYGHPICSSNELVAGGGIFHRIFKSFRPTSYIGAMEQTPTSFITEIHRNSYIDDDNHNDYKFEFGF
jgi:hypothetical protein